MSDRTKKALVFTDTDSGGVIHVANIKGGVGKSTVATNLAAALARRGPTVIVDLDVQGSATVALGRDPAEFMRSSWHLFKHRFHPEGSIAVPRQNSLSALLYNLAHRIESALLPQIIGQGTITDLAVRIDGSLDLIPANADLFKAPSIFHLQNLLYNLEVLRGVYKYIILDTPSVWNRMTHRLYMKSDLNLVPVTLNALSTKSLRDYLYNVKSLAEHDSAVRIRIIKNEVFGRQDSKIKGKTRTMVENRKFLDSLCEQVTIKSSTGISVLPQSIMFDLEIPESATVRDAQDEGKSVLDFHEHSIITKAFDELSKRVQYVLNMPLTLHNRLPEFAWIADTAAPFAGRVAAVLIVLAALALNKPVFDIPAPRPLAPQQLAEPGEEPINCTIANDESLYKLAKYAICRFRAMVPSNETVYQYVLETATIYNLTRIQGEQRIDNVDHVPSGLKVTFYPPAQIDNPGTRQLVPVYRFFTDMVKDPYAYVTGDWCERGEGGGTPHYGMDIAGKLGSPVITPVDGIAILRDSYAAGHTLGVVKDGMVVFFCHLNSRFFDSGDEVKKGDVIGTIGMTGQSSGPHVHVGYGVKSPAIDGVSFGRSFYKLTDPKLFFYREVFVNNVENQ